jgi:hypothetical protein
MGDRVGMLPAYVLSPGKESSVIHFEAGLFVARAIEGPKPGIKGIRDNR